jgi:succinyl-CoA synthetase alpha subunit
VTVVRGSVHRNSYRDSVELMAIAAQLEGLDGVRRAGLVMATPANLAVLAEAGLADAATGDPRPNDLVVALAADDDATATVALERAASLLAAGTGDAGSPADVQVAQTLGEGLAQLPDANLVLVSTPGGYATAEAIRALKRGLNVFLFSDNVSVEDEVRLKSMAQRRGLLVMGPDCGTAIVGGVPLGFANAVRRGPIGLVGASGTGIQQVSSLIHGAGGGVSHAFGTGGRDLDERVGGTTMAAAIDLLLADAATSVIVLISKPPAATVAARILAAISRSPKPVVVNFLGGDAADVDAVGAHPAPTFEAAARIAVALSRDPSSALEPPNGAWTSPDEALLARAADAAPGLASTQRRIQGLYSGGSLAGEAKVVLRAMLGGERHDRILDLGDDEFTVGRPHPMIDPRLRNEHIVEAASDPTVAALLLDVVLGYGSHPDPASAMAPAIEAAIATAAAAGRRLPIVASVCGTDLDPQALARQEGILAASGAILESSNARAAMFAASIAGVVSDAHIPLVGAAD